MNKIILILLSIAISIFGQSDPYADSVICFCKGAGSYVNQNPPYFPDNVLGRPSENASETVPATSPEEICSLGLGGEIILSFTNNAIVNGDGVDFTVFENAFKILYGERAGEIFAEPATVAVSKDGITFYSFPFDSLTLEGLAGKTPTYGNYDPTNPDSSGGDSFDLSEVGLDTAYFVKITDVTEIIMNETHPYFDPTANGFDLDAVVAVHSETPDNVNETEQKANTDISLSFPYPNPVRLSRGGYFEIDVNSNTITSIGLYDVLGKRIEIVKAKNQTVLFRIDNLASGIYFIKAFNGIGSVERKIILIK